MSQDFGAIQENWTETREKVRSLQSDYQKCLNERKDMEYSIGERRAKLADKIKAMRDEFEEGIADELTDIEERLKELRTDYDSNTNRLKSLGAAMQETLSSEVMRDKGTMAAGLGEPNGKGKEDEA